MSGYPLFPAATGLVNPRSIDLAAVCGVGGIKVKHAVVMRPALHEAASASDPVLVEAVVSSGELTLPPRIGLAQARGFDLSKAKEGLLGPRGDHAQWVNWRRELQAALPRIN